MGAEVAVAVVEAVGAADMEEEAVVIATTLTVTAPTTTITTAAGPMPILAAATAMSTNRILVVELGRMSSLSSPPIPVRARLLIHRQVPVVTVVDKMELALGATALRFLILLSADSAY